MIGHPVTRVLAGALLLLAAGFKAHDLWTGPVSPTIVFMPPWFTVLVIEVEIILGLWLVSGLQRFASWLIAVPFFAGMAVTSLYLAATGHYMCGCFGALVVSPWTAFGIDLAAVLALLYFRPPAALWSEGLQRFFKGIVIPGLWLGMGSLLILALLLVSTYFFFDSPATALSYLRGESITVEPNLTNLGSGKAGEFRTFTIQLRNQTQNPIRIEGGTSDATCDALRHLPITIPPSEVRSIEVAARFWRGVGTFHRKFVLYTNDRTHPEVTARITGYVEKSP